MCLKLLVLPLSSYRHKLKISTSELKIGMVKKAWRQEIQCRHNSKIEQASEITMTPAL